MNADTFDTLELSPLLDLALDLLIAAFDAADRVVRSVNAIVECAVEFHDWCWP